ncbi:hypothetical protein GCM10009858_09360 [Terrabacter carboxydivorans]|uniref:Putative zinc-finger domain-containing protein n=1 Tax=Terrabacter carboxydivorans TaxID=619730 RepID=A0ABP5Y5P3_9MICO
MGRSDDERDAGHEGAVELSGAPSDGAVDGVVEPAPEAVESVPEVTEALEAVEAVEAGERQAVWAAWRSLSDESRSLLWRLVIHEEKPRQIAPALGTTSSGVATQGRQARMRFRLALLSELVAHATDPDCREARRQLGGYVRDSLPHGARQSVEDHLDGCAACRAGVADVVDVDAAIRLRVAPALLPGAFAPPDVRDDIGEGADVGVRQVVQEASAPLAVGVASVPGAGEDGASPGAAVGDPDAAPGWDTAERVLSVPGRWVALVLAAAALVAAVALYVFQLGPTLPATANGPAGGGTSTRSADETESTYPSEGTTAAVAPRPVIGVATAESVLRYQSGGGSAVATGPGSLVRQARSTTSAGGASGRAAGSTTVPTSPSTPSPPTTPGPSTTRPGPVGAVTSRRLAPSDRGYLAHLQVPAGWLITSVQDVRGGRPRERLSSPTAVYDGRLLGGDLVIEVTRVSPDVTGVLTALFTDRSGATLPGSGDYPLR